MVILLTLPPIQDPFAGQDPVLQQGSQHGRGHPAQARYPSRQLGYRGSQPSSFRAFSFEDPREAVICSTTNSPASSRPSRAGTRSGGLAPAAGAR